MELGYAIKDTDTNKYMNVTLYHGDTVFVDDAWGALKFPTRGEAGTELRRLRKHFAHKHRHMKVVGLRINIVTA